jgi:hypothetical protein
MVAAPGKFISIIPHFTQNFIFHICQSP